VEKTRRAAEQQIAAMGAPVYEVGLYNPEAERTGKPVMLPRTWDVASLLRSIPWLRFQNSTGRNIYVRPRGEHNLSLVDDLAASAVERMKAAGFAPALVVETSPGNFQAWVKHPCPLRKELSTAAARRLAAEFGGDSGAADWRHFGRLAGFTNRKEARRQSNGMFPFVRLIEASGHEYAAGTNFIARVDDELRKATALRQRERSVAPKYRAGAPTKNIDSFRSNPIYGGDGTRIDLAYSIYALSHGCSTAEVEAALRSRSLDHKGTEKRQSEYVERTIQKATKRLDERGFVRGRGR
jgi:RepB DNA-primase from phage plasmid